MNNFNAFDWLAFALLAVGGLNWGLIGALNYDLVSSLFGDMTVIPRVIFGLVGVSAIYMVFAALMSVSDNVTDTAPRSRVAHP